MNTNLLLNEDQDDKVKTAFGPMLPAAGTPARAKCRIFMSLAQGMRCFYCKQQMSITPGPPEGKQKCNTATFEHLVDVWSSVDGKDDRLEKIVMACHSCNSSRNKYRQSEVCAFYAAKFPSKQTYAAFAKVATPADYIKMFGVAPDTWQSKK